MGAVRIRDLRVYRGPSYWARQPVIRLTVEDANTNTAQLPGFTAALLDAIPALAGTPQAAAIEPVVVDSDFVRHLQDGVALFDVIAHIAIALQRMAGLHVTYFRCIENAESHSTNILYGYREEKVGIKAGELAVAIVDTLLKQEGEHPEQDSTAAPLNIREAIEKLIEYASEIALGPSTQSIVDEALRRDIPTIRLNDRSLVQLGYGIYQRRIEATTTSQTNYVAVEIASDKELTKQLLRDIGIPVPESEVVTTADDAVRAAQSIGYPVVLKPLDASHGRGISIRMKNDDEVRAAFKTAVEYSTDVIVEQYIEGNDFRILVVNNEVVAVAQRIPAHIVGDGAHTVEQLIEITNGDPRRGIGHEKVLTRITIDSQVKRLLRQQNLKLTSIPEAGKMVLLRSTANISTGGTSVDRTNDIHYENIDLARRAARVIGLDIAGIDVVAKDITLPLRGDNGAVVEVNAAPGFRMHTHPTEGPPRNVAAPVLDMLFPPGTPSRIPIVAITGSNGKTTTTRMVAHIFKQAGRRVGMTTTDGIYIDGQQIIAGDTTGPWSAQMVLKDPTVTHAVLEQARGGILRSGLGYDKCDIGAVLNVTGDHLGLGGIHTVEQLADIKAVIIEAVCPGGFAVLNAEDPLVAQMASRTQGQIIYFSLNSENSLVQQQYESGGWAATIRPGPAGQMLTICVNRRQIPVLAAEAIPATLGGAATFNTANALAAAAISLAAGISIEDIRHGLRTFTTSHYQTPGRLNVFDIAGFRVIVDYGHNPDALQNMSNLIVRLRKNRSIGVLSAPGDRRDQDIVRLGEIAGQTFDILLIKEDDDRRGRAPGEAANLLKQGAMTSGMQEKQILEIYDEIEAINAGLDMGREDDLVVLFADNVPRVLDEVLKFQREHSGLLKG